MAWLVETLRATVFADDIAALGLPNWQTLSGSPPLQIVNNPGANVTFEIAPFLNHRVTIGHQLGRADLAVTPFQPPSQTPLITPPSIGDMEMVISSFMELARKWLAIRASIKRFALFGVIWEGAATPEAALDIILTKVPSFTKQPVKKSVIFRF
jgi:hypothetical protein